MAMTEDTCFIATHGYHNNTLVVTKIKGSKKLDVENVAGQCYSLAFSTDGRLACGFVDGTVRVLNLTEQMGCTVLPEDGEQLGTVQVHALATTHMCWSKDNRYLITAG